MKKQEEKILTNEITAAIATVIKDEFIATFTCRKDALCIRFPNGQTFELLIREV